MASKNRRDRGHSNIGPWNAVRDIGIAAVNRGQLVPFGIFVFLIVMLFKMPSEDVSKLAFEILKALKTGSLIGYGVSFFLAIGWYVHAKWQRRMLTGEIGRVGLEKSKLQANQINGTIESSET